ncbi:hypothetical protein NIIDMKKI_53570 [Mycobacterium kansasii]|uniref:Uncharacterized protein n=1 Tax=Mycobacterium kansasii TaxID=1768 RepID=A0A7G1IGP7_MYCKA|nr:hypothetical protein NIIDMKKI_53570 [Mycobacterium kansasii]
MLTTNRPLAETKTLTTLGAGGVLSQLAVIAQHRNCGVVQQDLPGFVVFRVSDAHHTGVEVDMITVQACCFASP